MILWIDGRLEQHTTNYSVSLGKSSHLLGFQFKSHKNTHCTLFHAWGKKWHSTGPHQTFAIYRMHAISVDNPWGVQN